MNSNSTFQELQDLWITQKVKESPIEESGSYPTALVDKLRSLQSFQDRMNKIKILVVILIFSTMAYALITSGTLSLLAWAGLLMALLSTLWFFAYYLRNQFRVSRLHFDAPTHKFLTTALGLLHKQNAIFKSPFTWYTLAMLASVNILFLGVLTEESLSARFQIHTAFSLWVMLASLIGGRIRQKRIRKEVLPVIEQLNRAKGNLDGDDMD